MPTDLQALRAKTEEDLRSGNYVDAVRSARRLLLSQPRDAHARMTLGRALYALERFNEARVEMISMMRANDAPIDAFRLYIEIAFHSGDTYAARDGLMRLLQRFPEDQDARHRLELIESGELSREVTIERWFDPLAAGTVEASAEDLPGDTTIVTNAGDLGFGAESNNPLAAPELNLEAPSEEPVEVMSDSWLQQPEASSSDFHLGSDEFQEVLMSFSSEAESISLGSEVNTLGSGEFDFLPSDGDQEDMTVQVAEQAVFDPVAYVSPSGASPVEASAPEYSAPNPYQDVAYGGADHIEEAPTQIRSVSGELSGGDNPFVDTSARDLQQDAGAPRRSVPIKNNTTHRLMLVKLRRFTSGLSPRTAAIVAGCSVALCVVLVLVISFLGGNSELSAAVEQADADGRVESLRSALALLEGDLDAEEQSLRARLEATLLFEHAEGNETNLEALFSGMSTELQSSPDAVLGHTYLKLAMGDVDGARELLNVVNAREDLATELARARSRAALAAGELEAALGFAQNAVSQAPTSPRHVSWLALLTAQNGHASAGLSTLAGIEGGDELPGVRVVRARILMESGSDFEAALREANAVVDALSSQASRAEIGWAQLVRARVFFERGELSDSEQAIAQARTNRPPGNVEYQLSVLEQLLELQDLGVAAEEIAGLAPAVRDLERARLLRAEVSLLSGELDAATEALSSSGESAQAEYLRGRLQEARGNFSEAASLYRSAEQQAALRGQARARRANLARLDLRFDEAASLIRPLWEEGEIGEDIAVVWFLLKMQAGDLEAAREALRRGRAEVGDRSGFAVQEIRLHLAEGRSQEALALANELVERRSNDAELHVLRYRAAKQENDRGAARESFEAASRLAQASPSRLLELAFAAQESGDQNAMEITVQAAERAGAPASRLYSLRGLMNTLAGRGVIAVQQLEQIVQEERSPSDWETLTRAAMQSGDSRLARRAAAQCATSFEGRIAIAELDINDGRISTGIAAARALAEDLSLSAKQRARAFAMLALGHSQNGGITAANAALVEAESLDGACSSLHLVRAELAEQGGRDVAPHLRMAVQAPTPLPDAVGWLALELRSGSEACRLAQQYLEAAPRGYDNREIRGIRCP